MNFSAADATGVDDDDSSSIGFITVSDFCSSSCSSSATVLYYDDDSDYVRRSHHSADLLGIGTGDVDSYDGSNSAVNDEQVASTSAINSLAPGSSHSHPFSANCHTSSTYSDVLGIGTGDVDNYDGSNSAVNDEQVASTSAINSLAPGSSHSHPFSANCHTSSTYSEDETFEYDSEVESSFSSSASSSDYHAYQGPKVPYVSKFDHLHYISNGKLVTFRSVRATKSFNEPFDVLGEELFIFNPTKLKVDVFSLHPLKLNHQFKVRLVIGRRLTAVNCKEAVFLQTCSFNRRIYIATANRRMFVVSAEDGRRDALWDLEWNQQIEFTSVNHYNGHVIVPCPALSDLTEYETDGTVLRRIDVGSALRHRGHPFSAILNSFQTFIIFQHNNSLPSSSPDLLTEVVVCDDGSVEILRSRTIYSWQRLMTYDASRAIVSFERDSNNPSHNYINLYEDDWSKKHQIKLLCRQPFPRLFPYRVDVDQGFLVINSLQGYFFFVDLL